jgi:SAM-dependent methyltransferase
MSSRLIKPLSAQIAGLLLVYSLSLNGIFPPLGVFWLALLQGCFAAIISQLLLSPRWWVPIHLFFLPTVVAAVQLQIPSSVYATGFVILALIYWSSFRTQVPLFLSNRMTVHRLAIWLPDEKPLRILDIGSGTGSFALTLARLRPDWQIEGIETAPAPYVLSRFLARRLANLRFTRGDFWRHPLGDYDLVYAFLSPVPMPDLWRKARREMRPGSLLISNSFDIPDQCADEVIAVDDRRGTRLYIYRIPGTKPKNSQ